MDDLNVDDIEMQFRQMQQEQSLIMSLNTQLLQTNLNILRYLTIYCENHTIPLPDNAENIRKLLKNAGTVCNKYIEKTHGSTKPAQQHQEQINK